MKAKDINTAINWGLGFSAAYFIGTAIAGAIKKHRSQSGANGIGAIKSKRRIWQEVEEAQHAGIDLTDKSAWEKHMPLLRKMANGKIKEDGATPMEQRYFNQLSRAYKSIAGTDLAYDQSVVRNEYGDVILVYNDYHLDKLPEIAIEEMKDNWWSPNLSAKGAMMQTIADIASGKLKFIWKGDKIHRGVETMLFGKSAPSERKQRISYLATKEKGGVTPEQYAHRLWERTDGQADDQEILNGVLEAILQVPSVGKAKEDVMWEFFKNHSTDNNGLLYQDVPF